MITTCSKCGALYDERSEERANEPERICLRCFAFAQLLAVADHLLAWNGKVDVTSSSSAADELAAITEEAKLATLAARRCS